MRRCFTFLLGLIILLSATGCAREDSYADIRDRVNAARQETAFCESAVSAVQDIVYLFNYYDDKSYQISKSQPVFSDSLVQKYFPSVHYSGSELLDISKEVSLVYYYIENITPEKITFIAKLSISYSDKVARDYKLLRIDYLRARQKLTNVEEIV